MKCKAVATDLKRKGDCRSPPPPISENDFKQLTMRKSCRRVRENEKGQEKGRAC